MLKDLLNLGDEHYLSTFEIVKSMIDDGSSNSEASQESSSEEERVDELELSLVDITPQFANLFSSF